MNGRTAILLAMLAGCAAQAPDPVLDTGTLPGEAGERRNRARLHTELASLYYTNGNMAVALDELRAAAAADSSYGPAHGMYGVVYMRLNEPARAGESFERALIIGSRSRISLSPLRSAATRFSRQIATGFSSTRVRRHAGSHGRSQVRPRIAGKTFDSRLSMYASE